MAAIAASLVPAGQTLTATIMTDLAAQGISFCTDGQVEMDITKYDLFEE